jgi:hypothetical protein
VLCDAEGGWGVGFRSQRYWVEGSGLGVIVMLRVVRGGGGGGGLGQALALLGGGFRPWHFIVMPRVGGQALEC